MGYDDSDRLNAVVNLNSSSVTLSSFFYGLDGVGNRTSILDDGTIISNWAYDSLNQINADYYLPPVTSLSWSLMTLWQWDQFTLAQWDTLPLDASVQLGGSNSVTYDSTGNRLTRVDAVSGDVTTYTYDAANRMPTAEDTSGVTSYTYDASGNQTLIEEPSGDLTTNTWDGENRLVQVEHPGGDITTYAYNGDGLRVEQDDGTVITRSVYDGNNVLQETDDVGVVEAEFTYIPQPYAEVISQHRDSESNFYQFDGINNVRQLTDDAQAVTDEYDFTAWGEVRGSTGSTANSQLYKGKYLAYHHDPNAEYLITHRRYTPETGRYTSEDPAEDDLNLYRPLSNNPINNIDPSGLQELQRTDDELFRDADSYAETIDAAIPHLHPLRAKYGKTIVDEYRRSADIVDASRIVEFYENNEGRIRNAAEYRFRNSAREDEQIARYQELEQRRLEDRRLALEREAFNRTSIPDRAVWMLEKAYEKGLVGPEVEGQLRALTSVESMAIIVAFVVGAGALGFASGAIGGPAGAAAFTALMAAWGLLNNAKDILRLFRIFRGIERAQSYEELEAILPEYVEVLTQLAIGGGLSIILTAAAKTGGKIGKDYELDYDPATVRSGPRPRIIA